MIQNSSVSELRARGDTPPDLLTRLARARFLAWNRPSRINSGARWALRRTSMAVSAFAGFLAYTVLLEKPLSDSLGVVGRGPAVAASVTILTLYGIAAIGFAVDFATRFRQSRHLDRFEAIAGTMADPTTAELVAEMGVDNHVIGTAIELFCYPFLDKRLDDNGWDAESVRIIQDGREMPLPHAIKRLVVDGKDSPKYTLVGASNTTADSLERGRSAGLTLRVRPTTWSSVLSCRAALAHDAETRKALLRIDPEDSVIPNSFCLHIVCLTRDNEFLVLKRAANVSYYPSSFSLSFEEQLSDQDGPGADGCCVAWFRRALCEEVFPLVNPYSQDAASTWGLVSKYVEYMRIWTCFMEGDTGNYSLLGVCKLAIDATKLNEVCVWLYQTRGSSRDNEGRLFVMHPDEVRKLLRDETARCRSLANPYGKPTPITRGQLHPTGLYRAATTWKCMS